MIFKRAISLVLIAAAIICCNATAALASNNDASADLVNRATGNFSLDVPANTMIESNTILPLDDGDMVVIQAAFTPPSADLDFGIVAPNGQFYYVNITGGIADIAIDITRRGNYKFAICNNSSSPVTVSGYINY